MPATTATLKSERPLSRPYSAGLKTWRTSILQLWHGIPEDIIDHQSFYQIGQLHPNGQNQDSPFADYYCTETDMESVGKVTAGFADETHAFNATATFEYWVPYAALSTSTSTYNVRMLSQDDEYGPNAGNGDLLNQVEFFGDHFQGASRKKRGFELEVVTYHNPTSLLTVMDSIQSHHMCVNQNDEWLWPNDQERWLFLGADYTTPGAFISLSSKEERTGKPRSAVKGLPTEVHWQFVFDYLEHNFIFYDNDNFGKADISSPDKRHAVRLYPTADFKALPGVTEVLQANGIKTTRP